jgi:signal peptidase I
MVLVTVRWSALHPAPSWLGRVRTTGQGRIQINWCPMQQNGSFQPIAPVPQPVPGNAIRWLRDVVISLATAIVVLLFFAFIYQPVRVEGISMQPGLQNNERLFINRMAYRFGPIERSDVVVFLYPRDQSKSYIKRVIAVPGDILRIDHGRVYLNGHLLLEPYLPRRYRDDRSMAPIVVPADSYFVLGDHRNIASDSREFGVVPRNLIYGKASFAIWPADKLGAVN